MRSEGFAHFGQIGRFYFDFDTGRNMGSDRIDRIGNSSGHLNVVVFDHGHIV